MWVDIPYFVKKLLLNASRFGNKIVGFINLLSELHGSTFLIPHVILSCLQLNCPKLELHILILLESRIMTGIWIGHTQWFGKINGFVPVGCKNT